MRTNANENGVFQWTQSRLTAASLVAEDKLTDRDIAAKVNVHVATLERWKLEPAFKAKVKAIIDAFRHRVMTTGIADRVNRVASQNERWQKMHQIIDERAVELDGVCAGGGTGLLVRQPKQIKVLEARTNVPREFDEMSEDDFIPTRQTRLVEEFAVDTGLLSEMRQTELHAAKELGQHVEKSDVNFSLSKLSDAELLERAASAFGGNSSARIEPAHNPADAGEKAED